MRIGILAAKGALAIGFLWCAAVQFNDPDPLPWATAYGLVAVIFALATIRIRSVPLNWISLGMLMALALVSLPGFVDFVRLENWRALNATMSASRPHIEFAREFLGAIAASTAVLGWIGASARSSHP